MRRHFKVYLFLLIFLCFAGVCTVIYGNSEAETLSSLTLRGYELLQEGKPDEAARLYRKILNEYSDIDEGIASKRSLMKVYNNLGYIYLFEYHSPERAYPLLLKSRDLALQYSQNDLLAASYDNIAKLYDDFGDTQNALKNFRASLQASVNVDTDVAQSIRLMVFDDLANFAINRELIDSIGDCIKLYDKFPESDIPMSAYTRQLARSLKLANEGKYKEAHDVLENAGTLINAKVDSKRYEVNHLLALATLQKFSGNMPAAITCLEKALEIINASQAPLSDLKVRVYNSLSNILKEQGKDRDAEHYRLQALEVTDSLYCAKKFGNIRDIESMTFIDELNKNVELSEMELRLKRRQILILGISIILILLLLIGLGWYTRKLNNTHLALVKRHKEAMRQREVDLRIHKEYRDNIESLKKINEQLEQRRDNPEIAGTERVKIEEKGNEKNDASRKIPGNPEDHFQMIEQIKDVFANNKIIYDSSFTLNMLAEILNSKPKYISILINDMLNTTFNQLLAEARVAESCRLLLDSEIGQKLTIEAVAEKVGYRSRTHFISIFNKITGLTPSQYIKASKKDV